MKPTHESRYLEVAAFAGAVFEAVVPYRKRSPLIKVVSSPAGETFAFSA
ncbi:MAG: hypothetical protein ACI3XM_08615 [Eubacteriales bacterium]